MWAFLLERWGMFTTHHCFVCVERLSKGMLLCRHRWCSWQKHGYCLKRVHIGTLTEKQGSWVTHYIGCIKAAGPSAVWLRHNVCTAQRDGEEILVIYICNFFFFFPKSRTHQLVHSKFGIWKISYSFLRKVLTVMSNTFLIVLWVIFSIFQDKELYIIHDLLIFFLFFFFWGGGLYT